MTDGKGVRDANKLLMRLFRLLDDYLREGGYEFVDQRSILMEMDRSLSPRRSNRSITGSINELVYQAKELLIDEELSAGEVGNELNEIPLKTLDHRSPKVAFATLHFPDN